MSVPLGEQTPKWRRWLTAAERLRPGRLGLRSRILLSFAFGSLLLSGVLASITFQFTRSSLLKERIAASTRQFYNDADAVETRLLEDPVGGDILDGLQPPEGTSPLALVRGEWVVTTGEAGPTELPAQLRETVERQRGSGRMLVRVERGYVLTLGRPLDQVETMFYEVVDVDDLHASLRRISFSFIAGSVVTMALGMLMGTWVSSRAVRPLAEAAQAANALATGKLTTRLSLTDDRDLRSLATSFNDMADALQERVERDARFTSDVSHELRSPLTTLSASIEVMQARRDEMPERAQAALDLMTADVARVRGLVEDLLEISRYDAGAVRLNLEELLVAEFVRQAVSVSSLPATAVYVSDDAENLITVGDKRRLARAVANLIDNGRSHGLGELAVYVTEPPDEGPPIGHVHIAVEDRGPGVPVEERAIIFQRFARGVGSGRRGMVDGSGLGLALVDEHVKLHGGRVWATDRIDGEQGARFVIELPAEEA